MLVNVPSLTRHSHLVNTIATKTSPVANTGCNVLLDTGNEEVTNSVCSLKSSHALSLEVIGRGPWTEPQEVLSPTETFSFSALLAQNLAHQIRPAWEACRNIGFRLSTLNDALEDDPRNGYLNRHRRLQGHQMNTSTCFDTIHLNQYKRGRLLKRTYQPLHRSDQAMGYRKVIVLKLRFSTEETKLKATKKRNLISWM